MPEIGVFHPQIVHFVIGLGIVGVLFRLVSLTGLVSWTRPAATALLLLAAVSAATAVIPGDQAHGPAERIPGAREAVHEHEEAGEYTRNIFLVIGLLELAAVALRQRQAGKWLLVASGIVGIAGIGALYKTGKYGGEVVYEHAGGVGTRSGDPEDVQNLLVAGLYHQARLARDSGRAQEAARLTDELVRQRPDDPGVALLGIESQLTDRRDAGGALAALARFPLPPDEPRLAIRVGMLRADAHVALGQPDSARAVLTALSQQYPQARFVRDALERLK